jgi:hypothetical protein
VRGTEAIMQACGRKGSGKKRSRSTKRDSRHAILTVLASLLRLTRVCGGCQSRCQCAHARPAQRVNHVLDSAPLLSAGLAAHIFWAPLGSGSAVFSPCSAQVICFCLSACSFPREIAAP